MTSHKVIITMMLPDYADLIISSLMKKGYRIETGWTNSYIYHQKQLVATVMYIWANKDVHVDVFEKDLIGALDVAHAQYYSIVIVPADFVSGVPIKALTGNIKLLEQVTPSGAVE